MSNVADTLAAAVGYIVTKDTFVDFVDLEHQFKIVSAMK